MKFPIKPWLSGHIKPSDAVINLLCARQMRRLIRSGMDFKTAKYKSEDWLEANEAELKSKFNLPEETVKYTLNPENWTKYQKLNSFKKSRKEALDFLDKNKIVCSYV